MEKILNELYKNQDIKYKDFSSKLIPEFNNIIGVQIPKIRLLSKQLTEEEKKEFMGELPHKYQEENILHGILISQIKEVNLCIKELNKFLPYVDNWCVCDTISPKCFKKNLKILYKQIKKWIDSNEVFTKRFAIVSLLQFYLNDEFENEYNELVLSVKSEEYYVNMAIAWYFSFALIKQYDSTIYIFENKLLDKWVHNKSIQKALEIYRIDSVKKEYLRKLKV